MLLRPNKTKYNKAQRGNLSRIESSFNRLKFGRFGIIAQESAFLTARQIEACRQVLSRQLKRKGKIWISVFPDFPRTAKPTEVRMGKGKGAVKDWVCRVRRGKILFEADGISEQKAFQAFTAAKKKLPLQIMFFQNLLKIKKKI